MPKLYVVPALSEDALIRMRAPPDPSEIFKGEEDDSADEEERKPTKTCKSEAAMTARE